jgi:hypothetical protein
VNQILKGQRVLERGKWRKEARQIGVFQGKSESVSIYSGLLGT